MTTTLTPRLKQIYNNIVINCLNKWKERVPENTPGFIYELEGIEFPIAEESDEKGGRTWETVRLIRSHLESLNIEIKHFGSLEEYLEVFFCSIKKSTDIDQLKLDFRIAINRLFWRHALCHALFRLYNLMKVDISMQLPLDNFSGIITKEMVEEEYKNFIIRTLEMKAKEMAENKTKFFKKTFVGFKSSDESIKLEKKAIIEFILESENMWETFRSSKYNINLYGYRGFNCEYVDYNIHICETLERLFKE